MYLLPYRSLIHIRMKDKVNPILRLVLILQGSDVSILFKLIVPFSIKHFNTLLAHARNVMSTIDVKIVFVAWLWVLSDNNGRSERVEAVLKPVADRFAWELWVVRKEKMKGVARNMSLYSALIKIEQTTVVGWKLSANNMVIKAKRF